MLRITSFVIFAIFCVAGCTSLPITPEAKTPPTITLDQWIKSELIPYTRMQLHQHAQLQGKTFAFVGLRGDRVRTHIDAMTEHVRERLRNFLLSERGLHIARRNASRQIEHHRSLEQLPCVQAQSIDFYIGIDTQVRFNNRLRIAVRALRADENAWVPGFSSFWEGEVPWQQTAHLSRAQPDDYLLGLRAFPYTVTQADHVASYLAHNLSCLLRQRLDDQVILNTHRATTTVLSPFLESVYFMLDEYLVRFHEVTITNHDDRANVSLHKRIHLIDIAKGLYRISLTARFKKNGQYLFGQQTETYVILPEQSFPLVSIPSMLGNTLREDKARKAVPRRSKYVSMQSRRSRKKRLKNLCVIAIGDCSDYLTNTTKQLKIHFRYANINNDSIELRVSKAGEVMLHFVPVLSDNGIYRASLPISFGSYSGPLVIALYEKNQLLPLVSKRIWVTR